MPDAVRFWCAALDYQSQRAPAEAWAILAPRSGAGQQMAITLVTSQPEDHQRHHIDLYAEDAAGEVERLIALGARRVAWRYPQGSDYVVLADPDGNTFCVVEKGPPADPA